MLKAQAPLRSRGNDQGVWFKLAALHNSEDPLGLLMQLSRHYGGCIPLRMHSQRVFLLTEVEYFKHVLMTRSHGYSKYFEGLRPIFGGSMITLDGALWQKMRLLQQPAFHPDMIGGYIPQFITAIRSRMERWGRRDTDEPIDICEETWALAADMTCKALFDREMPFNPHLVFNAVKAYTNVTNHRSVRFRVAEAELCELVESELAQAAQTWVALPEMVLGSDPREGRERTLLRFLEAAAANPEIPEFNRQQVLDEIKQYIWAGTETTALTLAWALYLVSTAPHVAERIRHETDEVLGDREPTGADYPKLAYTRNVIQEAMRMYPPIWSLVRRADADDTIGTHRIQSGDTIVLCTYLAHHDPRYWDEPKRFDPDRFTADGARNRAPYSYLPFGGGKRACIGGAMSQVENVLALALFLRDFDLEYVGQNPPAINPTVTLSPRDGLPFRIRPRSRLASLRFAPALAGGESEADAGCLVPA